MVEGGIVVCTKAFPSSIFDTLQREAELPPLHLQLLRNVQSKHNLDPLCTVALEVIQQSSDERPVAARHDGYCYVALGIVRLHFLCWELIAFLRYSNWPQRPPPCLNPSVSLCIPAFNNASTIGEAMESAIAQEGDWLEILVIDDGSRDRTLDIATRFSARDRRVRCFRNEHNLGLAGNFSACIGHAKGTRIQILCADDVLQPGCTARLARALDECPSAALAVSQRMLIDADSKPLKRVVRRRANRIAGLKLMRECFVWGNRIGEPSAVMFRKNLAGAGFNSRYSQLVDLEFWFRLLAQGDAVFPHGAACSIRRHAAQMSQSNLVSGRVVQDKQQLFTDFANQMSPPLRAWEKGLWDWRMALSISKARAMGGRIDLAAIEEVFFPTTFHTLTLPAVRAAVVLGAVPLN